MKKRFNYLSGFKLFSFLFLLFSFNNISAQNPQNPSWTLPPFILNFNSGSTSLPIPMGGQATNISADFSHTIQQDLNGNILFYVVDGIIYNYGHWTI